MGRMKDKLEDRLQEIADNHEAELQLVQLSPEDEQEMFEIFEEMDRNRRREELLAGCIHFLWGTAFGMILMFVTLVYGG